MALTPNYLQKCTDGIERQYQQLVTEILVDLADRISHAQGMTSTAEYLNEKLREMSLHQVWINQMLAKVLNTTEKDVEKLMEESTYKSTRSEIKNLEAHGYDTSGLEFASQIEKSTNVAKNELTNLTRTTGQLATAKLMNIYDQAYLQVSTGAYSYDQAVTNAVKKLAKDGLGEVTYPTGAKRTVEAAVRVAVRTSVSQNALKCEEDMLDDMDVNLVEVSSHLGARPSHAVWQGKIYWRKHPEGNYENFYAATGYGTPTGLGGYNCRHQHYAYFGDDDEQAYHHIDETLNKEAYDMEQKQRSLERKLREWDRKEKILNAGGVDSTEAKRWKSYYKKQLDEHVKSSNGFLKRDYAAEKALTKGKISKSSSASDYTAHYSAKGAKGSETSGSSKGSKASILSKLHDLFNREVRRGALKGKEFENIQEMDEYVSKILIRMFKGYNPAELVDGDESRSGFLERTVLPGVYTIKRTIVNAAHPEGDTHVNLNNPALANDIHERGHDLITQLAMKRCGYKDGQTILEADARRISQEVSIIEQQFYLAGFTDESYEEILETIDKKISNRAVTQSELLSEALVDFLGKEEDNELANVVVNTFKEEWDK